MLFLDTSFIIHYNTSVLLYSYSNTPTPFSMTINYTMLFLLGQHDDARMNVALALTAAKEGATVANHVEVISLLKEQQTKQTEDGGTETKQVVCGARMKDTITGKEWETRAHVVVNATGPFTDQLRTMDNPDVKKICQPSAGVHIVLPSYYRLAHFYWGHSDYVNFSLSPKSMGLLDPSTSDGRVIFFLPWEGVVWHSNHVSMCHVISYRCYSCWDDRCSN